MSGHEHGDGCGCDGLLFECPTGAIAHAVPLALDAPRDEVERYFSALQRAGPDALLPCGVCRAGDVFKAFGPDGKSHA